MGRAEAAVLAAREVRITPDQGLAALVGREKPPHLTQLPVAEAEAEAEVIQGGRQDQQRLAAVMAQLL